MGILQLLNLILLWVFFGYLASYLASKRGRNRLGWFFLGLTLGLIGVLLAFVLPNQKIKKPLTPPPAPRLQRSDAWLKLWYYLDPAHQQQGPLEFPDLAKLRKERQLGDQALIWGEGMKEWRRLCEMPDLLQEIEKA